MSQDVTEADILTLRLADQVVTRHFGKLLLLWDTQDIANSASKILIFFDAKTRKAGGRIVPGKIVKIADHEKAVSKYPEADYKILLSAELWRMLNQHQQEACLYHFFAHFDITEDGEDGSIKVKMAKPDVNYFSGELQVYGAWRPLEVEENGDGGPVSPAQDPDNIERALGVAL